MIRTVIPDNIRSELSEAVRKLYPNLPLNWADISKSKDGYNARVTLENISIEEDGTKKCHGTLSAIFEYRGQWRCTRYIDD